MAPLFKAQIMAPELLQAEEHIKDMLCAEAIKWVTSKGQIRWKITTDEKNKSIAVGRLKIFDDLEQELALARNEIIKLQQDVKNLRQMNGLRI